MITIKDWGYEDEVINLAYCGKRMLVREQHRCSIHKHEVKDEVLMVGSGLLWFETGTAPDALSGSWMSDNDRIRVQPGTWHRFTGLRDTTIFEFSTHHEEKDSIRHLKGGKVVEDDFRSMVANFYRHENRERILTVEQAAIIADVMKKDGRRIGMVNGCFDLMHLGHVELLRQAKQRCEILFVAVNSDASVQALKGKDRPFVDELGRMALVESNRYADYVVEATGVNCVDVVKAIIPDIYITTSEYGTIGPEAKAVEQAGGTIEVIELVKGYNTTAIATRVKQHLV